MLVASPRWRIARVAVADSLVAAIVTRHGNPSVFVDLHRLLLIAGLVESLASANTSLTTADDVATFLRTSRVLLPRTILSLTPTNARLARRYGFSELTVVRDDWYEYRLGEIAHVENALQGEIRERSHRRLSETEITETVEEERETEESSDVQKTDRFEMSSSSSQDMSLKASVEATVDVSAEYPSTTVDVHAGGSFDYSQEQSREQATTLARTIARAVKRVQDRVSVLRASRTLERFEEANLHRFENTGDAATTIVAIYRWVDKVQRLQAFHYPHRFLLELQIPEPAAFVHWRRKKPPTGFINSPPPEFVVLAAAGGVDPLLENESTRPLAPTDITEGTYLHYARRYRIGDIEQPPPQTVIKSVPVVLAPPAGSPVPDDAVNAPGDGASVSDPNLIRFSGGRGRADLTGGNGW